MHPVMRTRPGLVRGAVRTCAASTVRCDRHNVCRLRLVSPPMAKPRSRSTRWRDDSRSDSQLLLDARRDPEAFGEFYSRNFRPMITYFWSRTRDHDVASDLAAETFAAALLSVGRYDPAKGVPRQWLYGIANNQLKRLWRSNRVASNARRRLELQTPPIPSTGWEEIEAADAGLDADRLTEALTRLPARNREAVRLRIIERLGYGDIAERLGCEPVTARSLVFRGLRRLRDEFDPLPHEEDTP